MKEPFNRPGMGTTHQDRDVRSGSAPGQGPDAKRPDAKSEIKPSDDAKAVDKRQEDTGGPIPQKAEKKPAKSESKAEKREEPEVAAKYRFKGEPDTVLKDERRQPGDIVPGDWEGDPRFERVEPSDNIKP